MRTRTSTDDRDRFETRLLTPPADAVFGPAEVDGLPEPVRRHLTAAIAAGTPLATSARLRMRGSIRLGGRWLPTRARQILSPQQGFVWSARVAGVITGSDRYADGHGSLDWKLLGLVTVMHADGADVARSAAARAAAEAVWLPTTLLPRFGVRWSADDDHHLVARYSLDEVDVTVRYVIDDAGHLLSVSFDRWGDPDETGTSGFHPFGVEFAGHRTFGGLTVPDPAVAGWFHGTDRWPESQFFRSRVTRLEPVGAAS
jgi:hypothetical protein